MSVVPLSTMANGKTKNEVGEYTTHTTRQCIHVDKMEKNKKKRWVHMRSISSAASIFILHSQGIGGKGRGRGGRKTRTLIDTNDNTYLLPNGLEKCTHTVAIRRMSWLDDIYLRRILQTYLTITSVCVCECVCV